MKKKIPFFLWKDLLCTVKKPSCLDLVECLGENNNTNIQDFLTFIQIQKRSENPCKNLRWRTLQKQLTNIAKLSILDVYRGPRQASETVPYGGNIYKSHTET